MTDVQYYLEPLFGAPDNSVALSRLAAHAQIAKIVAGTRLFASGEACENFVIVVSGQARVQLSTRTGRDVTLFRLGPGQSCALTTSCLLSDSPYYAEGIAETDLEMIAIPSVAFREAMLDSPKMMRSLLDDYAGRIASLTSLIDRLTSRDIDAELTDLLLGAQDASGRVRLSHKAIADELGTAREVISRKLKSLERVGAVKLGRGSLRVLDPSKIPNRAV